MQSKRTASKAKGKAVKNSSRLVWATVFLLVVLALALMALPHGVKTVEQQSYPLKYSALVEQYATEYAIDPLKIYAIIRTESGFDPNAQSDVDARGLMQITEQTFAWIKLKIANDEAVVFDDLYDPALNIRFGAYYLSRCLERYGDFATASAAYHSGWGTVDQLLTEE
ncbi:MAG: lytic transglycosylase domain-containing protein, partial [Pygmaiobacter sp.]